MLKRKGPAVNTVQLKRQFARLLRQHREKRQWSLREMSDRSGISLTRLWNYEKGNHSPNLPALAKLSAAFDISLSKFVKPLE